MADSTTHLDTIAENQADKEVTANETDGAESPAATYGPHDSAAAGFNFAIYGGKVLIDGTPTSISNQTINLSSHPSTTIYVYLTSAGVVTVTTSIPTSWPGPLASSSTALYTITTDADGVTGWTDWRIGILTAAATLAALGAEYVDINSPSEIYLKLTAPGGKVFYLGPFETP